jgi:hypothetical protein
MFGERSSKKTNNITPTFDKLSISSDKSKFLNKSSFCFELNYIQEGPWSLMHEDKTVREMASTVQLDARIDRI